MACSQGPAVQRSRNSVEGKCCACSKGLVRRAAPRHQMNVCTGGSGPVLWKNNVLLLQKVASCRVREHLSYQALRICCGAGNILADMRRFCAVATRRNSSFAPAGPRNRSLPNPRMRLRWAKSISTLLRSRIESLHCLDLALSRAT